MTGLREMVRNRLEAPEPDGRRLLLIGAVVLALIVVALYAGFTHHIPLTGGEGGALVRAQVATAEGVSSRTPVRVAGVSVGHVDRVLPGPGGRGAIVVMRITDSHVVPRMDASAVIRWRTILGGSRYVDLDPGAPSAPPLAGATIPLPRTGAQVDWDQFNDPYTAATRRNERAMLRGLRDTLAAPGAEGRTLRTLGPALAVVGKGTEALRGQDAGDLTRLVQNTARTVAGLSRDQQALEGLVDGAARTFAVTARERTSLGRTIALSPPALAATTQTMNRLRTTLGRLDPLVARLRPGAQRLDPAMHALRPALTAAGRVLSDARPLLRIAPGTFAQLAAMSNQGTPLLTALDPTVKRLNSDLIPFLGRTDSDTKLRNYEAIGPFISALDSAAGEFDASGNFLHFMTGGAPDSVLLPCDSGLSPSQRNRCDLVNSVLRTLLGGAPH